MRAPVANRGPGRSLRLTLPFGAVLAAITVSAAAAPTYSVNKVLVAEDQYQGEKRLDPAPLYKPHEVVVAGQPKLWITSNEREGQAGITVFGPGNRVLALVNIEEPGLEFTPEAEEETIGNETEEEVPEPNFPSEVRFNPTVCLPVKLYPGSTAPSYTDPETGDAYALPVWNEDPSYVCAPLGAEGHARHPHGIDLDRRRGLIYQVIEHAGLKWNATRSEFEIAETTDDESGMLLVYSIEDPAKPTIVDGFLLGHGAHEVAVNDTNGKVFQGNHEDSPGVVPPIWVDVIDRGLDNPYGFIDTGYYNAIQGIEVDEPLKQVFGTTHVGEALFAFDGDCVPTANEQPTAEKAQGENCILYSVDLRQPFVDQIADAEEILGQIDSEPGVGVWLLPSVLHMHDLTVDPESHRAYQTLHSIHHAEHTGSPEEAALEDPPEDAEAEPEQHFMGRWVASVDVNPRSKGFKEVRYIDLSNGYGALAYPNADEIPPEELMTSFVHAHWVAADPKRRTVLVTGEHTGNLGVVETKAQKGFGLAQVVPISIGIPGCEPPVDETGVPVTPEPHVHGVQIDPRSGEAYVSDEGEDCFYESVTILKP